jgi:hypothetical protein
MARLVQLAKEEEGATAIEYGLIAALIAVAAMNRPVREIDQGLRRRRANTGFGIRQVLRSYPVRIFSLALRFEAVLLRQVLNPQNQPDSRLPIDHFWWVKSEGREKSKIRAPTAPLWS